MRPQHKAVLEQFGRELIQEVRDAAHEHLERVTSGMMRDSASKAIFEQYQALDAGAVRALHRFITLSIDACLVRFLNFLDEHEIGITVKKGEEIIDVRQLSDGLVGELYTEDGWIAKYSQFPPTSEMREWYGLTTEDSAQS